jgi:hypothetical protein
VRTVLYVTAVALCTGALYLVYRGARLVDANVSTGAFSGRFWEAIFWLKYPPHVEHGLADNGRSWVLLVGGALLGLVGWKLLRIVGRMGDG